MCCALTSRPPFSLKVGCNDAEKSSIIRDMIRSETKQCLNFASQNPEISLPEELVDALCTDFGVCTLKTVISTNYKQGHCWLYS